MSARCYEETARRGAGEPFPVRDCPRRDWFDAPTWLRPDESWAILDNGRVGGYLYEHDQRSTLTTLGDDAPAVIRERARAAGLAPSPSRTGFAAFHAGVVVCDDGRGLAVGSICWDHPPLGLEAHAVSYEYENRRVAIARVGEDTRGVWVAGSLAQRPYDPWGLTYGHVAAMRSAGISGDWRRMSGDWWHRNGHQASLADREVELVGVGIVHTRGRPVPPDLQQPSLLHQRARDAAAVIASIQTSDRQRAEAVTRAVEAHERLTQAVGAVVVAARPDTPMQVAATASLRRVTHRARVHLGASMLARELRTVSAARRLMRASRGLTRALEELQVADLRGSIELAEVLPQELP